MSATERNIHLGVLGASLAVCIWVFGARPRSAEPATHRGTRSLAAAERSALSLIPAGAAFTLSVDVRALSRAPLGAFIAERLGRSAGASKLIHTCGFDPLMRLEQLALAIPSANLDGQARPDFGVIATGRFSGAEITRCARTAIHARGGEAIETQLGSFDSVRDATASGGEIAAKDGLVVVSGGSYFRELLDSAEGKHTRPALSDPRSRQHADLRRALGPGALLVSWLLGDGWFERFAGGGTNARLSPLSALERLGARVNVAETAQLLLLLECADSDSAARIATLLSELRSSLGTLALDPTLAAIAQRITVKQTDARLRLELELNPTELTPALDALDPQSSAAAP
ncbi:MAG TPA: hypothetical protein VER12_13915 [Polyangiaceae bacterium]|nr:hypothetical protein [Polyangiaceae bacterium]